MHRHPSIYPARRLCALDPDLLDAIVEGHNERGFYQSALLAIAIGASAYGWTFGAWRSAAMAASSAIKLPVLMLAVAFVSLLINTMLAQVLGARVSFRQVARCFIAGYAIVSLLLGSLSPAVFLIVWQSPPSDAGTAAMTTYRILLVFHIAVIAACGLAGNFRCIRMLNAMTGSRALAWRILAVWIAVTGFTGTQLSWLMSPFLCRPDTPEHLFNPLAFESNFFEYVWRALQGTL